MIILSMFMPLLLLIASILPLLIPIILISMPDNLLPIAFPLCMFQLLQPFILIRIMLELIRLLDHLQYRIESLGDLTLN